MTSVPVTHNLVLLHTPGQLDVSDFLTIRNMMLGKARDIEVSVISVKDPVRAEHVAELAKRPTLLFSPMPVRLPAKVRGKLLAPPPVATKYSEYTWLTGAGFPTPRTVLVERHDQLAAVDFEPVAVIKPNYGLRGRGVNLIRTALLKQWTAEQLTQSPSFKQGMLVQDFVDTGTNPTSYRVMTVLGEPIYCIKSVAQANMGRMPVNLSSTGVNIASNIDDRVIVECYEDDVIALASAIHRRIDFAPVLGTDIVRDVRTSELHVLELNSNGSTWHLSSDHGKHHQRDYGLNKYDQFNALKTITDRLITETRRQAI
jgi:hypothetical protein